MQEAGADGEGEEVVDNVENDKFADLAPDFGFVGSADVEQERINHLAGVLASKDSFESSPHRRKGNAHDVCVFERRVMSQAEQFTDFFGGQGSFAKAGASSSSF